MPLPEGRGYGKGFHRLRRLVNSSFHPALLQNSVEKYLDRRRRERSEPGATSPRRMVMRHGGGRGAEAMFRGAEPLCGCAAQGRKRAGRGYMLPLARVEHGLTLWQRMLPLKPEQSRTPRTTPSTRFCNREPALEKCSSRLREEDAGQISLHLRCSEHFRFENAPGVERSETPPRRRSSRNSLAAYSSGATYSSADRLPHS